MANNYTGLLLDKENLMLFREWFQQATDMLGIKALYRAPREEAKQYDLHGELDAKYYEPIPVNCFYQENVNQQTAKLMGWNHELNKGATLIVVPYELKKLQQGGLFVLPSAIDNSEGRVFKVLRMEVSPVYPSEVICELGPMFKSELESSQVKDFSKSNFNLLNEEEEYDD